MKLHYNRMYMVICKHWFYPTSRSGRGCNAASFVYRELLTLSILFQNCYRLNMVCLWKHVEGQYRNKMEIMIELQKHGRKNAQLPLSDAPLDVMTLLSMPDHLRKTAMTLCRLGRATADQIAEQTKRARAVESAYLNQLVLMGYLKKERKGRKAYFFIDRENQGWLLWAKY